MENKMVLIGEKLGHSFSKKLHSKIFEIYNLNYKYELLEIEEHEIKEIITKLKNGDIKGINVTIPYKEKVIKYLDKLDETAKLIGAVNTICFENNKVIGYNTDYFGIAESLKLYNKNIENAYILGTGGASKSIQKVLKEMGVMYFIVSRNSKLYNKYNNIISYNDLEKIKSIDLLINATPVGMYPEIEKQPVNDDVIKKCNYVFDLVYNPKETLLLKKSINGINGIYMLILQGIKSEEIWFGEEISHKLHGNYKNLFNEIVEKIY